MPPKKAQNTKASSSSAKVDKTFGMKNKGGGKGQKMVAQLQREQAQAGRNKELLAKEKTKAELMKKKEEERIRKDQLSELFKPAQIPQKVPFGTDPKDVLCINFKNGYCEKAGKCKFSHDPEIGRKKDKINLYEDIRDDKKEEDTMENWDEAKLREVVEKKGIQEDSKPSDSKQIRYDIVCKHFLQAIEDQKYGYFWVCPEDSKAGNYCKYRHALPPGFVLKSQRKKEAEDEKAREISLEQFLETERHKLGKDLTPVTPESFAKWKATRQEQKDAAAAAIQKSKEATAAAGKVAGMTGRDLFTYNPLLYQDDDDEDDEEEWDLDQYRREQRELELAQEEREAARLAVMEGNFESILSVTESEAPTNGSGDAS